MTPAERVVVEAALRWRVPQVRAITLDAIALIEAVDALQIERAAGQPQEQDLTWGQVVEGDEIYSSKTDKWYPVTAATHQPPAASTVSAKGIPRVLRPMPGDPIRVRRGATGQAVDVFASVLWSGSTSHG
jgi:hypothetical protein